MNVFLDTNIFHNNWHLKSAPLRLLFHYLNNEGGVLLASRLVMQEVENLYKRGLDEAYRNIHSIEIEFRKLYPNAKIETTTRSEIGLYDFRSLLKNRVEHLDIFEYEGISQTLLASRAMLKVRPFRENEKGFRDTLIWISLLDHIEKNNINKDLFFITGNTSDFMGAKGQFHDDLQRDIASRKLSCKIHLISSLQDFLKAHVDINQHALDRNKAESDFSSYLEENAIKFLESSEKHITKNLSEHLFSNSEILSTSSPVTAEVVEGVEDFYFIETERLDNNDIYISCIFELRIVELKIDITSREFENNRNAILRNEFVFEVEQQNELATAIMYIRPGFLASFTYNEITEECNGFTVESFALVKRGRSLRNTFRNKID
ncbi:PIN domain-containing protein [Pseudomonas sp. SM4]|uniref:PIN domain-containing protein n=1 Tax=Pseudomonas sp. SM4 TaxID=3424177 RepID=UPI003F7B10F0